MSIYRDGVIARHKVSSSLTRTQLGNLRLQDKHCNITNVPQRNENLSIQHSANQSNVQSDITRVKSYQRHSKFKQPFLSANSLFPKKMPRSIEISQKSSENPLHIFYPVTEINEKETQMIYINNSSLQSRNVPLILIILFLQLYKMLESK